MTIYLSRQYNLSVDLIGYAMTVALTIGVVFSLGFGILADKFDKKRYMLLAICGFASGFIAIPLVHNVVVVVLLFALINCAYSVFATVLKAWFADNLSATNKTKIFSLNYTVLNIGWTVGPPLGTLLVMQSINLPFWLAAACSALPLVFIQTWVKTFTGSIRRFKTPRFGPRRYCCATEHYAGLRYQRSWRHSLAAPSRPVFHNTSWWLLTVILPKRWWPLFCPSTPPLWYHCNMPLDAGSPPRISAR
jgi:Major Facilitator Superfamily.